MNGELKKEKIRTKIPTKKMYKNNKTLRFGMKHNKRGFVDILFFVVIVACIAIFFLVTHFVSDKITDQLLNNSQVQSSPEAVAALNQGKAITNNFDYIWLFLFVGLLLGTLIASVLIDVHWIFIPIWIILFGASLLVGVIMNNIYAAFVENSSLTPYEGTFASAIIGNYVLVIIGVGILSMILMFGKTFRNRGQNRL